MEPYVRYLPALRIVGPYQGWIWDSSSQYRMASSSAVRVIHVLWVYLILQVAHTSPKKLCSNPQASSETPRSGGSFASVPPGRQRWSSWPRTPRGTTSAWGLKGSCSEHGARPLIKACTHTCLPACMHTCMHTCIHAYMRTYLRTHAYTHRYTYIYIYTYIADVCLFIYLCADMYLHACKDQPCSNSIFPLHLAKALLASMPWRYRGSSLSASWLYIYTYTHMYT